MERRLAINREDLIDRDDAIAEAFGQCLDDCTPPEVQSCLEEAGCPDATDNWDGCDTNAQNECIDKDCICACEKQLPAEWLICDCAVEGDCEGVCINNVT